MVDTLTDKQIEILEAVEKAGDGKHATVKEIAEETTQTRSAVNSSLDRLWQRDLLHFKYVKRTTGQELNGFKLSRAGKKALRHARVAA